MFLQRRLPILLDQLKPNPRRRMHEKSAKQKAYHNQKAEPRSFEVTTPVWVQNERSPGCMENEITRITGTHSYQVAVNEEMKRKHADQFRSCMPPPTPPKAQATLIETTMENVT